jgi:transcriptional regulator with XRE-family HTH domain
MPGNPSSLFGKQVRKQRAARGWSLDELSERTGIVAGHLSRIENGRRPPTGRVAASMDTAFGTTDFTELYEEMRDWGPPGFKDWSEQEENTASVRDWSPSIVTGLLQVSDYAAELLRTYPGVTGDQVTARLARRMERQRRVLARDDPPLAWFVVDQMALYREVGPAEVMAAQMGRLAEVARLPNVVLQVLPAIAHPANASGFMITDQAALCEHVRGSFVYTDDQSVSVLGRMFATILSECWPVSESLAHIEEVGEIWTAQQHGARAATQTPTAGTA